MKVSIVDAHLTAVCNGNAGKVFSAKEIQALIHAKYPEVNVGSTNVSDFAASPKQSQQYQPFLYSREATGYKVLAVTDRKAKPVSARGPRGQSLEDALKTALAKVGTTTPNAPVLTPVVPVVAAQAASQAGKPNGVAAK